MVIQQKGPTLFLIVQDFITTGVFDDHDTASSPQPLRIKLHPNTLNLTSTLFDDMGWEDMLFACEIQHYF